MCAKIRDKQYICTQYHLCRQCFERQWHWWYYLHLDSHKVDFCIFFILFLSKRQFLLKSSFKLQRLYWSSPYLQTWKCLGSQSWILSMFVFTELQLPFVFNNTIASGFLDIFLSIFLIDRKHRKVFSMTF